MNTRWKRIGQVVNVLFSSGLGYFVRELGLKWHLPFLKKLTPAGAPPSDLPVRLRKAMEELGGAYLKLGQFLALRPDLLPPAYCDEFKKLLDQVPPLPFATVKQVIETSLRAPIRMFFSSVDPNPVGSASIAQVHRATLKNGKQVVIKVQRPEAKEQFKADIEIMHYLAQKIEARFRDRAISPLTIVKEFERYTAQELNFVLEGRTIDRFVNYFAKSKTAIIPNVHWPATTNNILTMDYLDGIKLTDVLRNPEQYPRTLLAQRIADAGVDQVLRLGLFHADLHPGNILVMPGNRIGILDFGIVGMLTEDLIKQTLALYSALVAKNPAVVRAVLLRVGVPAPEADLDVFARDVERIVNGWYGTEAGQARVSEMLQELFESAVMHHIAMPVNLILLGKALVTLEGTCLALDPGFNLVQHTQSAVTQLLRAQRQPAALLNRFTKMSKQYTQLLAELPQQASDVLERVKRGSVSLTIHDTDIKHIGMDVNRSSNRLAYALIIASLLVSGALLIEVPPKIGTYSLFTLISLMFAGCLLLVLLVSVVREGTSPFDTHAERR